MVQIILIAAWVVFGLFTSCILLLCDLFQERVCQQPAYWIMWSYGKKGITWISSSAPVFFFIIIGPFSLLFAISAIIHAIDIAKEKSAVKT